MLNLASLQNSKGTWIYNIVADTWSPGPPLNTGRKDHACTSIKDEDGNVTSVLIAGGYEEAYAKTYGYLKSTEIFHTNEGFWKFGPDLVRGSNEALLIDTGPSTSHIALLMGGYVSRGPIKDQGNWEASSYIYRLNRFSYQWEKMGNLRKKRNDATAVHVPFKYMKSCS